MQNHQEVYDNTDNPKNTMRESESFKLKIKKVGRFPAAGNSKDIKIAVSLKYLSNFCITLEIPINYGLIVGLICC